MTQHVTKVAPSLRPFEHLLVSKRAAARARKWAWAWWCTCPDGYGAAKTEALARAAADAHTAQRHPDTP
ncbi:hypothetical protein AB0891_25510 [Streptomyces sp. NPDC007259]|uniref:hypothetical protein n=1 Tax=Streptomyces sp. NPDC007259 TaxID=3154319 RepID=UPI003455675A